MKNSAENFEQMAANYDTTSRIERADQIAAKLRERLAGGQGMRALEYGCGTGLVGLQMANLFDSLLLVDSSPAMITLVKRKLRESSLPHIFVLQADFLAGELPDARFDCIFTSLVLHHIEDTTAILHRFYQLLSSGGRLLIVDLEQDNSNFVLGRPGYDDYHGFDRFELVELIKKVGFKRAESEVFLHDVKHIEGNEYPYSIFVLEAQK